MDSTWLSVSQSGSASVKEEQYSLCRFVVRLRHNISACSSLGWRIQLEALKKGSWHGWWFTRNRASLLLYRSTHARYYFLLPDLYTLPVLMHHSIKKIFLIKFVNESKLLKLMDVEFDKALFNKDIFFFKSCTQLQKKKNQLHKS